MVIKFIDQYSFMHLNFFNEKILTVTTCNENVSINMIKTLIFAVFFLKRKTLAQGRLVNDSGHSSGKSRGVLAHGIGTEQSIAYIN